jgi:hypothetical protein
MNANQVCFMVLGCAVGFPLIQCAPGSDVVDGHRIHQPRIANLAVRACSQTA